METTTTLSLRRLLATTAGLVVGMSGALALGMSPAQAQEDSPEPDVTCQQLTLERDYENERLFRAWLDPTNSDLEDRTILKEDR